MKPRFEIGDRVFHLSKQSYGVIKEIINAKDPMDVRTQGFRYEIQHSGWLWSVPENSIRSLK